MSAGKRRRRRSLEVAAWNAHNAPRKVLRRYIRRALADGHVAIVLTEVWRRHPALRAIAKRRDLTMLCEAPGDRTSDPVDDRGDMVVLLASGFELEDWDVIPLTTGWRVFSAQRDHKPQRLIRVLGTVEGQRVELLGVHGPTGGNRAASAEFLDVVAQVLTRTRPDTLPIAAGDFNVRLHEARTWARANGLRVAGHGPDLVASRGARVRSRTRGRRGSDHEAMSHTITPRKRKS